MTELLYLQEHFQQFLLSGQSDIYDSVIQTESVSVDTRLGIYHNAYNLRLIECLSSNFPSLSTYLGTEQFDTLATHYVTTHPSSYRSIRWYGDLLPFFIKTHYPKYAHLAELADFEWKMGLTFDAADVHLIQVEDMAAVSPEAWAGLQFILHPSLHRINYSYTTIPLWQALTHDQKLPEIQRSTEPSAWVLWRKPEYIIQFYSLSCEEAWALDSVLQGISFGALCKGLCQWINPEEVGMRAASYLKSWIQNGMISQLLFME